MAEFKNLFNKIKEDSRNVIDAAVYFDGNLEYDSFHRVAGTLNCYSVSKNFTATAIGIACDRGLISTNTLIIDIFPDYFIDDEIYQQYKNVTVHHVLNQTVGIKNGFLFEADRYTYSEKDWLKLCLSAPLEYEPGEIFTYSNTNYYILSRIISRVTGMNLDLYLKKNLFYHLDINTSAWERCPSDEIMGATGLFLSTSDMIKLGILYMDGGDGIISHKWIVESTRNQVSKKNQEKYGYGFWIRDDGYSCNGAHGQTILVYPEKRIVFAAHGCTEYDYEKTVSDFVKSI